MYRLQRNCIPPTLCLLPYIKWVSRHTQSCIHLLRRHEKFAFAEVCVHGRCFKFVMQCKWTVGLVLCAMFICDVARIVLGYNWGSCRSWDWAEEDKRGEMVYVLVALCFRTHRRDWGTHDETGMFPPCIRRDNRVWVWIPGQMLHTYTLTHTLNLLVCWFLSRNWGVFARPVCARCHTRSWLSCICMRENKQPYLGENWGSPLPVAWRRHAVVGSSTFTLQSVSVCVCSPF